MPSIPQSEIPIPKWRSASSTRDFVIFLLVITILVLAANAFTLTTYPVIHTDEPWYANLAYNWLTTGNRWTTLDIGAFPEGRGQSTTLLGALPTRLAVQLGGLSLQAIRLPSLLAGMALLGVTAAIGSLLWPGRSGPLAALVLALQPLFLMASHLVRPEIWLALVVMLALECSLLGWKRSQPLWDVAAALLTVLSLEIHQNGAVFAVGLAATYVPRYGRTVLRERNSLAFLGTSLLGALMYLCRSAGWLPRLFAAQSGVGSNMLGGATPHSIPLLSSNPLCWFLNEVARYAWYFGHDQMGALLLGFAVGAALRRRTGADRLLLAWLLGSAVAMMLLVSRTFELYLLPMISVGTLFVGRGMAALLQHPEPWGRRAMLFTLTVLMLPLPLMVSTNIYDPAELHRELRESVPCARILGLNRYWLAFTECDYRSFDVINHYHHTHGFSFEESMAALRPEYLVFDETIEEKLQENFGPGGDMIDYYGLPRAEFERFLDNHTTPLRLLIVPGYGTIQIRQVHWGTGS
jgi:4-amino-4-deoxy-L-arabinose transferase-like glycosyltransferase